MTNTDKTVSTERQSNAELVEQLRRLVDDQEDGDAVVLVQRQLFNRVVGRLAETLASHTQSPAEWHDVVKKVAYELMMHKELRITLGQMAFVEEAVSTALRAASITPPAPEHPDDLAVDRFAVAMKAKLKWEREERGRSGWQAMTEADLSRLLVEHLPKGDPVDVANFCMMLSENGQRISPAAARALASPAPLPVTITPEQAILDALQPFHDAVFNDNGDITVNGPYDYEFAVAAYFAHRKLTAALGKPGEQG